MHRLVRGADMVTKINSAFVQVFDIILILFLSKQLSCHLKNITVSIHFEAAEQAHVNMFQNMLA
jgi:hypothetical protein